MKLTAFIAALLLGTTAMAQTAAPAAPAPAPAPAAEAPKPAAPAFTFALKGFVSMSAAYQDGSYFLSEGQQSLAASTAKDLKDPNSLTFDVRQSRFNFSVKGPQVLFGATPTGVLEIDFYGGNTGGNFGNVSILPRLRVAYSELNWGAHKLQIGQQNDLIFAMAPTSLSHIGFPLGYFTGNLGWRRPGVFGYHSVALPSDMKLEAAWEIGRSQWADIGTCTVTDVDPNTAGNQPAGACTGIGGGNAQPNGITLGEASGGPALEGRVTFGMGKLLSAFVAAHYNQVDLTGVGANASALKSLTVQSFHAGAKVSFDVQPLTLTLQATGFTGKNVSPLIGQFIDFKVGPATDPDITTIGYWAQAGVGYDKLSLWVLFGDQKPDSTEAKRAGLARLENQTTNVLLMYRDGGYGLSAEWIGFKTTEATYTAGAFTSKRDAKANQYMATANYFF